MEVDKISSLLLLANHKTAELLEEELGRAQIVPKENLPTDTVSMNSEVLFQDLNTGQQQQLTLVYPHEARIEEGRVSILAPIGAALIGLRVGQEIEWPLSENRVRRIRVLSVRLYNQEK
jgi:regulator of nucleoside diphosphate kinase